jgi:hypothetical protein
MYLNINGAGLLLEMLALTGFLAFGLKLASIRRRRPGSVRVRHDDHRNIRRHRRSHPDQY